MTKKTEVIKGLTLDDFMLNTNLSKPEKLILQSDGVDTDHYLMVSSAESKQVSRDRIEWALALSDVDEKLKDIENKVERGLFLDVQSDRIRAKFAKVLVTGWSFGEFDKERVFSLLEDNAEISRAVIAKAFAISSTTKKK